MESLEDTIEKMNLPESQPEDRPERVSFKPGEEVFVRNSDGKLEDGWEVVGIDPSGIVHAQREVKHSGVPTGDMETVDIPLDQLKKDFVEGFRRKQEIESLANHVDKLLEEREQKK